MSLGVGYSHKSNYPLVRHIENCRPMNVLLVDDHGLFRDALEALLLDLGVVDLVLHAQTAKEAIDTVKSRKDINLVLLDYNLEDGLGIDVLLRIKSIDAGVSVAIVSADDEPTKIQKCLASGANGYLLKRMTSSEMRHAINNLIKGEMVVPPGVLDKIEGMESHGIDQLAEVARNILTNQDLSIRASDIQETPGGMVSAFNQLIDHLQDNQQKLEKMAFSDELTGLYNRRYFFEQLDTAFKQQARSYAAFALVYIDLDKFKEVNDTLGHQAGDALLSEIAKRIKRQTRESDVASRVGGDEFSMILYSVFKEQQVMPYLKRILRVVAEPFEFNSTTIYPSASIGAALSCDYRDVKDLIRSADEAMYKVKQDGRNGVHVSL